MNWGGVIKWLQRWVLHAIAPGSNPVLMSALDLLPVASDSTLPRFVNKLAPPSRGFLIMFLFSLNCYFQFIKSGVPVNKLVT